MQIDRVLYPIRSLGPGDRIGIWVIGCPHHCYNCSNPELWESDIAKETNVDDLVQILRSQNIVTERVTITGGEPFYQSEELLALLQALRKYGFTDILVYTGYTYETVNRLYPEIINLIDVLIDGPYVDSLNDNKGLRGSSNQIIHIINNNLKSLYDGIEECQRERQNFITDKDIICVGIPLK